MLLRSTTIFGVLASVGVLCAAACSRETTPRDGVATDSSEASLGEQHELLTHSSYVPAGYFCKTNDEFGGDLGGAQPASLIDASKWTFQNLRVNNEAQNYSTRQCAEASHASNWNYCVQNGALTIRALADGLDCRDTNGDGKPDNSDCADNYGFSGTSRVSTHSSGRIISKNKWPMLQYGYVEMRARLPFQGSTRKSGLWPAGWFLYNNINEGPPPGNTAWPWSPELDLLEWQSPNGKLASNAIFIGNDGNMDACNAWPEGGSGACNPSVWTMNTGYNQNGWHLWGMLWTASGITTYLDGVQQGFINTAAGSGAEEFATSGPMFAIFNLAVGGDLGGAIDGTINWPSEATFDVDYIRWYQSGGSDTCSGGTSLPPPPRSIAANLEAESYDEMLGVQYESTTDTGGGQNAGWIESGDYIGWNISVPTTGTYTLTSRSAASAAASYNVLVDGVQVASASIASTGGWQSWQSFTTPSFNMTGGTHSLRIVFTSGSQNLNYVKVNSGASCTPTTCSAQGKNCGSISNGCGGTLACGSCASGSTCNANVCTAAGGPQSLEAETGTLTGGISEAGGAILSSASASVCWPNVAMGGSTQASVYYGNGEPPGDTVKVTFNGVQLGSAISVANTGGWSTYQSGTATFAAQNGTGTLCVAVGTYSSWVAKIDKIVLNGSGSGAPVCGNGVKEGTEQCDDGNPIATDACNNSCISATCTDTVQNQGETGVDCGGPCAACPGKAVQGPGRFEAEAYTAMSGLQFETCADTGGGQNAGYTDAGDYLEWQINVPEATAYTVAIRHAGAGAAGNARVQVNGVDKATVSLGATGGWQTWQTRTTPGITLATGTHTIRLVFDAGAINVNYIDITTGGAACTPATCASVGATCGSVSNGCGGTLSCGTCGTGYSCSASNQCVASAATPCGGICANPVVITTNNPAVAGGAFCYEKASASGANTGGFAGRGFTINGAAVTSPDGQNVTPWPAPRNGGYCFAATQSIGWLSLW